MSLKFYECHWCDHRSYTHIGRAYHIRKKHPLFFKIYDMVNGWFSHKIPDAPEGKCTVGGCDSHRAPLKVIDTGEIQYHPFCAKHLDEGTTVVGLFKDRGKDAFQERYALDFGNEAIFFDVIGTTENGVGAYRPEIWGHTRGLVDDIDVEEHLEDVIDGDDVRGAINADEPVSELDAEHDELDDIPDRDEIEEEFEEILDGGDSQ